MAKPGESYETYEKVKLLGEGSFGKAYLVKAKSDGVSLLSKLLVSLCHKASRRVTHEQTRKRRHHQGSQDPRST